MKFIKKLFLILTPEIYGMAFYSVINLILIFYIVVDIYLYFRIDKVLIFFYFSLKIFISNFSTLKCSIVGSPCFLRLLTDYFICRQRNNRVSFCFNHL